MNMTKETRYEKERIVRLLTDRAKKRGHSVSHLARLLRCSTGSVQGWQNGTTLPCSKKLVERINKYIAGERLQQPSLSNGKTHTAKARPKVVDELVVDLSFGDDEVEFQTTKNSLTITW